MASTARWSSLVVLAGLVLLTPARAHAVTVSVSTACSGTGIQGSVVDGSTTIHFKVCPETSPYWRFESWYSGGDITELLWNTSTATGTAWVGGVELTTSLTQAQKDTMMGIYSSSEGILVSKLFVNLADFGLNIHSDHMKIIGGAMVLHPDPIETQGCGAQFEKCDNCGNGAGGSNDFEGEGCTSSANKCLGCCGIGCWGCTGICTQACLDHDCCQRQNGFFSCLGGLFTAIGSLISAL